MNTEWKYRPKHLEEYLFPNDEVKKQVMQYIVGDQRRPLILHGIFGTGKSLLADLIPKAIDGDAVQVDKLNGTDLASKALQQQNLDRPDNFDALFEPDGQSRWYTIVEEMSADIKAKEMLRVLMDKMQMRTQFIFTTNELEKIDGALQSRSKVVEIPPLKPLQFLPRAEYILQSEGLTVPSPALEKILDDVYVTYRDNRKYYEILDDLLFEARLHHQESS
jgi:DNA polymerase III delta prime subunit